MEQRKASPSMPAEFFYISESRIYIGCNSVRFQSNVTIYLLKIYMLPFFQWARHLAHLKR